MKTKILILLIFFLTNIGYSFAQDDVYGTSKKNNSNKFHTGFVFINGKYIDAPYHFKIRNGIEYCNNIPLSEPKVKQENISKKYKIRKKPILPNNINSWDEFINYETNKGRKLFFEFLYYYFGNFPENEAKTKMIKFIGSLPFVINVEVNENGSINIETNETTIPFILNNPIQKDTNKKKQSNSQSLLKTLTESYKKKLKANGTLYFVNNILVFSYYEEKTLDFINKGISIINDSTLSDSTKIFKLIKLNLIPNNKAWINQSVFVIKHKIEINHNFIKRVKFINEKYENNNSSLNIKLLQNFSSLKSSKSTGNSFSRLPQASLLVGTSVAYY